MERLIKLAGGTALALTALAVLEPGYAAAATIVPKADDLQAEEVSWIGDGASVRGYLVHPKGRQKRGAVVVIHENRGLTPHIRDVTQLPGAGRGCAVGGRRHPSR
jgi:carboxymethylenebutenolidase